jgi:anti-sigma B factor antagonist
MTIIKTFNENTITLAITGRLDTITSVQLSDALEKIFSESAFNLIVDLSELEYISSAGLRVLLSARKQTSQLGTTLEITGVNKTVKEIFSITGFAGTFKIS